MKNAMRILGFVLVAVVLATACAPPRAPSGVGDGQGTASSAPKRITAAIFSAPGTLNSMIAATAGSSPGVETVGYMVNAGLTVVDNEGNLHPVLAEAVPSIENGLWKVLPDGRMEITWRVRPNAEWHDGTAFTTSDILFTSQLERDRELAVFRHTAYAALDRVEAPDAYTLVTQWSRPYIHANLSFGFSGERSLLPLPRHILSGPYAEDKARFTELPYWTTELIGTGPYKVREFVAGSHLLLDANDRYVLGRPKIDHIEVKFIRDASVVIANMLAGAVDVTLGRSISLESGSEILDRLSGAKMDLASRGAVTAFPQFINPNPPVLANLQFRRALLHAANRQDMVDSLMLGRSSIAHTFINPREADYKDIEGSVARYEYDPRRAAQLIEGIGYTKGADGFYRDAAGQRIALEIHTQGGRGDPREAATLALANYWQRLGVAAEPFIIPPHLTDDAEFRANFPAFDMARRGNYRWDLQRVLSSAEAPLPENRYRGGNRGRYQNAELDTLIDRYERTVALTERTQVLRQIVQHVSDQVLLLGLFYDLDATVYAPRLHNVYGYHERSSQAWNVHLWEVS